MTFVAVNSLHINQISPCLSAQEAAASRLSCAALCRLNEACTAVGFGYYNTSRPGLSCHLLNEQEICDVTYETSETMTYYEALQQGEHK